MKAGEDFGGVAFGLYFVPDFLDFGVGANQETAADDAFERAAHEFFHAPDAVGLDHFVGGIAEQWKIELMFDFEVLQRFDSVGAGAQYLNAEFVELGLGVAELGRLDRSTGGTGLREKKQDDTLALEIPQGDFLSMV